MSDREAKRESKRVRRRLRRYGYDPSQEGEEAKFEQIEDNWEEMELAIQQSLQSFQVIFQEN